MAIEKLSTSNNLPLDTCGTVLVYTGTFAPVHLGHADAMSAAAAVLHERDERIDMAVFVPKHDKSLQVKLGDMASVWDFDARVSLFTQRDLSLAQNASVYVDDITGRDSYETTIGEAALDTITGLGVAASRAVFVVGSDRGDTAKTLLNTNRVICVRRPEHMEVIDEDAARYPWLQAAIDEDRYIITGPQDPSLVVSSTAIRAGEYNGWGDTVYEANSKTTTKKYE